MRRRVWPSAARPVRSTNTTPKPTASRRWPSSSKGPTTPRSCGPSSRTPGWLRSTTRSTPRSGAQGARGASTPSALAAAAIGGGAQPNINPNVGTGGTANPGSPAGAPASAGSGLSTCVISFPGFLFFSGPCLLTKGGVKWMSGVAALAAGVAIGGFGVVLLASTGFGSSGAKQAVGKVAKTAGIGASLFAGQPEAAAGIAAVSKKSAGAAKKAPARTAGLGSSAPGQPLSRREDRQAQQTIREQGIGPRGGNPTSRRIADQHRRGTSVPGARRRSAADQRRPVNRTPNTVDGSGMPF